MTDIDGTLFTLHFDLSLCTTEKDFHKRLKRFGVPAKKYPEFIEGGGSAWTHILTNETTGDRAIIVTIRNSKDKENIYFLIHEAVHIWQAEIKLIGEENPSDEFMAYSIQNISQRLIEAYKK